MCLESIMSKEKSLHGREISGGHGQKFGVLHQHASATVTMKMENQVQRDAWVLTDLQFSDLATSVLVLFHKLRRLRGRPLRDQLRFLPLVLRLSGLQLQ